MIHIRNLHDCQLLTHDPDLQREVTSYLLYCQYEIQEYAYDDEDFDFVVLAEEDLHMLHTLGTPEETVRISIKADGHIITIYRIIFPTTVIFVPTNLSDQISF